MSQDCTRCPAAEPCTAGEYLGPCPELEPDEDDDAAAACPYCGTLNDPIGALGRLAHYTCRACGLWYHEPAPAPLEVVR